jgi:circadian clock protein KaiC
MSLRDQTVEEQERRRVASRIDGLDTVLEGGFLAGGLYIIQGNPGTGKTILGNQICFNHAARGGRVLYLTLLAESHSRMMMHLSSLEFFNPAVIPESVYYISAFTALEQTGLQGLLTLIRKEAAQHGAQILVLDGLVAAERRASSDMEFKKFIHELQVQASMLGCTMFLLTSGTSPHISAEHTMVDGVLELSYRLYGWYTERDVRVLKRRGADFLAGLHAFDISNAGITVYPRIEVLASRCIDAPQHVPRSPIASGVEQLDQMMGGGIPGCSTTLLLGASGIGKTTLGLQYLSQCSAEECGVLLGFYETPAALRAKADALGLPFTRLVDQGAVEILWMPATEASIDEVCARLLYSVQRRKVRRVFIDGLEALRKLATDPPRVTRILSSLSMQLQREFATTIYTGEIEHLVSDEAEPVLRGVSTSGVSSVAENIIAMRFVESGAQLHRVVSVVKVRDAGIDGRLRLFKVTDRGLQIDGSHESAAALLARSARNSSRHASAPRSEAGRHDEPGD